MDDRLLHEHKVTRVFFAVLAALFLAVASASSQPEQLPFAPGEKLLFKASWLLFDAGMIEASVPEISTENGDRYARLTLHTWTTETLAKIFQMDDRFESQWEVRKMLPRLFTASIRESHTIKDKRMEFDHATKSVIVTVNDDPPKSFTLNPLGQDFFSASYFIRAMKLEPKKRLLVPVFEDNKNYNAQIDVIKRERLRVMGGELDTLMIIAKLRFEGAFQSNRSLYVWLTDDNAHVPVRLEMSFIFGTIRLDLVQADSAKLNIVRTADRQ